MSEFVLRTLVGAMGRREHQRRRTARGTEGITGTPGAPHTELHAGHTKEQDRRALNEPSSGQGPHTATAAPERRQTRNAPGNAGSVSRQRCPPRGGARPGPPLTAAAPRRPLGLVVPRPAAPRRHRPPRTTGPGAPRARPRGSGSGRKAAARPGHPAAAMSSARESQSHHGLKRAASPDVTGRGAAARREGLGGAGGGGGGGGGRAAEPPAGRGQAWAARGGRAQWACAPAGLQQLGGGGSRQRGAEAEVPEADGRCEGEAAPLPMAPARGGHRVFAAGPAEGSDKNPELPGFGALLPAGFGFHRCCVSSLVAQNVARKPSSPRAAAPSSPHALNAFRPARKITWWRFRERGLVTN